MKRNRTFSETQTAYMLAKATYDAAFEAFRDELNALNLDWENDFDAACEKENVLYEKHRIHELQQAHLSTEKALVNWAHEQVKVLPKYRAHRDTIVMVFDKGMRLPSTRQRLVDLCMSLQA